MFRVQGLGFEGLGFRFRFRVPLRVPFPQGFL